MRALALLILFWSCSKAPVAPAPDSALLDLPSRPIHELIDGWNEMLLDIEASTGRPQDLRGREYSLRPKLKGHWNLEILPGRAFRVRPINAEGEFKAVVENPELLFEVSGGLSKMAFIAARLSRVGGQEGSLSLSGHLECLYPLSFYQRHGDVVNFQRIQESYNVDFIISHPHALQLQTLNRFSALFKRQPGGRENVTVKLKLTSKVNGEVYVGEELGVPLCSPYQNSEKSADFVPTRPGECLHHLKTDGSPYAQGRNQLVKSGEHFLNRCRRPVSCEMPAQYAYLNNGKVAFLESKTYFFTAAPLGLSRVDTSWNFNSYQGSYSETLSQTAKISRDVLSRYPELKSEFALTCQWAKAEN